LIIFVSNLLDVCYALCKTSLCIAGAVSRPRRKCRVWSAISSLAFSDPGKFSDRRLCWL